MEKKTQATEVETTSPKTKVTSSKSEAASSEVPLSKIQLPFDPKTITTLAECCEKLSVALDETGEKPLAQVELVVEALGIKKSVKLLRKSLQIEENGGMMVYNQSRRRTLGGIFFFLAQRWVKKDRRYKIWPEMYPRKYIDWAERLPLVDSALTEIGEAGMPRITLIGRPGRIIEKGRVVLTSMQRKKVPSSWPRGLPPMPKNEGPYIIYITAKQWRKVKRSLNNKKDELIVEGYPTFNSRLNAITVFSQRTTTKLLEQARREKQKMSAAA